MPPHNERRGVLSTLLWGFRIGATRRVLQAYHNAPGSMTRQASAARQMLASYQMGAVTFSTFLSNWSSHIILPGTISTGVFAGLPNAAVD
jgi:hypothetical protein